jgi:uncharacterized protein (TIGR03083 family)
VTAGPPQPVLVLPLFPLERAALLGLLRALGPEDWMRPTIAGDWTVKDIASHLVADDLGRVSRQRDGHQEVRDPNVESLSVFIDRRNADWIQATRRLSPAVLISLLEFGGRETQGLFEAVDPFALGGSVSWAGPDPAPVWLDLAREFTERWHHQQQIRDALAEPGLTDPVLLGPVLATFAFSLAPAFREVDVPTGTAVDLRVDGPSGGKWSVIRGATGWALQVGRSPAPAASVSMDEDTAWRMYVRAMPPSEVERRSILVGDETLARRILAAFALVS